jgi:hypothetical protein
MKRRLCSMSSKCNKIPNFLNIQTEFLWVFLSAFAHAKASSLKVNFVTKLKSVNLFSLHYSNTYCTIFHTDQVKLFD